jgi:hypothetical protein
MPGALACQRKSLRLLCFRIWKSAFELLVCKGD